METFFFAQKAFIVNKGALLLVQKSLDDPFNPGKWEVPGGRMTFGEDVDAHICREVQEEVGIEVLPERPFFIWQWLLEKPADDGSIHKMQIVAVARLCRAATLELKTDQRVEDDYLGEIKWVPIPDLRSYEFIGNMLPVLDAFLALNDQGIE